MIDDHGKCCGELPAVYGDKPGRGPVRACERRWNYYASTATNSIGTLEQRNAEELEEEPEEEAAD